MMDVNASIYPQSTSWAPPPPAPSHLSRIHTEPFFYSDYSDHDEQQDFVSPHFSASEHYYPTNQIASRSPHLATLAPLHTSWNAPDEQPQNASRPITSHYPTLNLAGIIRTSRQLPGSLEPHSRTRQNPRAASGRPEPIPQHDYAPSYGMDHAYEQDHVHASASHVASAHQQNASPTDLSQLNGTSATFDNDQESDEEMGVSLRSPSPPSPPSLTESDVPKSEDEDYLPYSNASRKPALRRKQATPKSKKRQARSPAFSKEARARYQVYPARAPHVYYASEEEANAEVQITASPRPYFKKEERVVEIHTPSPPQSSRSSSEEVPLIAKTPVSQRNKSCSSRAKTEGRFIEKLFSMLSKPDQFGDVIRWDVKGEVVVIAYKEARLASVLLDQFGHSTFSAFGRQHAVYGFKALEKGELATLEIGVGATKFADAKFCRAWRHKEPGRFNRNSKAEEVAQIMAIPSRARQAAAARREAEEDRRLAAWTSGQKTTPKRKRSDI